MVKIQLMIVALLVGVAYGHRGWGYWPYRPRAPPVPAALTNWVQMREYVNVSIVVEPSVYTSSIDPALSKLQPLLSQAGVQVSDASNGKRIAFTNHYVGDIVRFLINCQNDTNSGVTIVDQGSIASFTRGATEFLFQVTASQRQLAAKIPTKANLQLLFRNFGDELGERMENIVRTVLSPLQNLP